MKYKEIMKKMFSLLLVSAIISSFLPTDALAQDTVTSNVTSKSAKTSTTTTRFDDGDADRDIQINIDVNLVQRTMNILDVAKFNNVGNHDFYKSDYKSDLKDQLLELLPEYAYADIVEYTGFSKDKRSPVTVHTEADSAYAAKIEWLIEHNMYNRFTYYAYSSEYAYMGTLRTPRPDEGNTQSELKDMTEEDLEKEQKDAAQVQHKLYFPNHKISKTDFLTELMKADKVFESRPIASQSGYTRETNTLNLADIIEEPIEVSPYAAELGKTGLDYASHEVVANHETFGQTNIMVTNDVTEMYLDAALRKNIVSLDEFGGDEGMAFIGERSANNAIVPDGYMNYNVPLRQAYKSTNFTLHDKITEPDIKYPDTYEDGTHSKVKQGIIDTSGLSEPGALPPWGHSYHYNTDSYCLFVNPANKQPMEIVKRPSVVEVNNNYYNYKFKTKDGEEYVEKGYTYFTKEEITTAEAFILVYKLLLAMGDEGKLTDTEVQYLNSKYSLNFSNYTEEERQAAEYLVAKGIVDGGDPDIYLGSSASLTNEEAVDLIYRVANPEARIKFSPVMTSIDKEMATKGYSQATVTKTGDMGDQFEVLEDVTKGCKVIKKDENDNETVAPIKDYRGDQGSKKSSYTEIQNSDRVRNPSTYDLVYVRIPKFIESELGQGGYCKLMTDDERRIPILPINSNLNFGKILKDDEKFNASVLEDGEVAFGGSVQEGNITKNGSDTSSNLDSYVLKDKDGYYWMRYILHKTLSSKVFLQAYTPQGTYTIKGIRGEGVYLIDEDANEKSFRKVGLFDVNQSPQTERIEVIVKRDLELRNYKPTGGGPVGEEENLIEEFSTDTVEVLWQQENYGDKEDDEAEVCSISLSKISNEEDLKSIMFNGAPLFTKDENGDLIIDKENMKATQTVKDSMVGLVKKDGRYYLQYRSPYQNSIKTAYVDVVTKMSKFGNSLPTADSTSMAGYAKISANGETIALIGQEELAQFGIVVKGSEEKGTKTGRMLMNTHTGQRAFINSADHTTWIGNNVTQYGEDDLLVTATGEGTEKKIYYNLAVILELINDTKAVMEAAGSEIFVAIDSENVTASEEYRKIDIIDVYKGTTTKKMKVDTTYVASVDDFNNTYVDLSAITGVGSNYFYYKDHQSNVKALVVYKPSIIYDKIKNYDPAKGAYDSTSSLTMNVAYNYNNIPSSVTQRDTNEAKRLLIQSLMGVSEASSAADLLKGNYIINVYVLNKDNNPDTIKTDFNTLIDIITRKDHNNLELLQKSTSYVKPEIGAGDFAKGKKLAGASSIAFYNLVVSDGFVSNSDFVAHKASGNIYALLNKNKKPYYNSLASVIDSRLYLQVKNLKTVSSYEALSDQTDADASADVIHMRYRQFYEETPFNYIPLEVFGTVSGRKGVGITNNSGDVSVNLNTGDDGIKLSCSSNPNTTQDANAFLLTMSPGGGVDMGLATILELPYKDLSKEDLKSLFSAETISDKDKFLNQMYDKICTDFDSKSGDYKIKNATGNAENSLGSKTGWSYLNNEIKVKADLKTKIVEQKDQFFQGMWRGISAYTESQCYYRFDKTKHSSTNNYVLIVGDAGRDKKIVRGSTCYIGRFLDSGCVDNITPVSKFEDLPGAIRYYIKRNITNECTLDANNSADLQKILDQFDIPSNEAESLKKELKIFYKPTLTVPAGTTVLKVPTGTSAPTELILYPNKDIRSYFYPAKDIVNSVLMMAQEKDDATFLYQLPKGSMVLLPNSGNGIIKMTEAMQTDKGGKYKWVLGTTLPSTDSSGNKTYYESKDYLSEARLLQKFILEYYNNEIPMADSVTGGTTNLGEILGAGAYRLPVTSEIEYLLSAKESENPAVFRAFNNTDALFGYKPTQYTAVDGILSYNPLPYYFNNSTGKLCVGDETRKGAVVLTLNLPPSLQVKQTDIENTWEIVSYWNVENFNASAEDQIVSYIRERDTEVVSVTEILKSIKAISLDGTRYTKVAQDTVNKTKFGFAYSFLNYGIPSIVILFWLYLSVLYVMLSFGWTKVKLNEINQRLGYDLIERITFGIFDSVSEVPSILTYLGVSFALFLLLELLWGHYLTTWVAYLIK